MLFLWLICLHHLAPYGATGLFPAIGCALWYDLIPSGETSSGSSAAGVGTTLKKRYLTQNKHF